MIALLFSGGKDSCLALHELLNQGLKPLLITLIPKSPESKLFHYPNVELTSLQAKAMELEHKIEKAEDEIETLERLLEKLELKALACGVIASNYQKRELQRIADKLSISLMTPLWKKEPLELMKKIIELGFKVMITGVAAEGLDEDWLGKILDFKLIGRLTKLSKRYGINLAGEGGEFETFVLDGPMFKHKLKVMGKRTFWDEATGSGYLKLELKLLP